MDRGAWQQATTRKVAKNQIRLSDYTPEHKSYMLTILCLIFPLSIIRLCYYVIESVVRGNRGSGNDHMGLSGGGDRGTGEPLCLDEKLGSFTNVSHSLCDYKMGN